MEDVPPPPPPAARGSSGREISALSECSYVYSESDYGGDAASSGCGTSADAPPRRPSGPAGRAVSELSAISDGGYRFWDASQVQRSMDAAVGDVTGLLCVGPAVAVPLLRRYKWDKEALVGDYWGKEEKIMEECGVLARGTRVGAKSALDSCARRACLICFDEKEPGDMFAMMCDHEFCRDCWSGYLEEAVGGGPKSINTKCPHAGCSELVTEEEIGSIAPDLLPAFRRYQLRSYVESNWSMRWCPGPSCAYVAVASSAGLGGEASCACGTRFCLRCGELPHTPASCDMLSRWKEKCADESETTKWILVNTKKCPRCKKRIEKNGGCNHMHCSQCDYHFCWLCMLDWNVHGYERSCNRYDVEKANQKDWKKQKAEQELERYLHYFQRFEAHSKGQEFAEGQLKELPEKVEEYEEAKTTTGFMVDWRDALENALRQIIECRRVLRYTYVFAFYMDPAADNRGLYEDHQEQLEGFTEKLSANTEKSSKEINYMEVTNLTRVVKAYIANILDHDFEA